MTINNNNQSKIQSWPEIFKLKNFTSIIHYHLTALDNNNPSKILKIFTLKRMRELEIFYSEKTFYIVHIASAYFKA